LLSLAPVSHLFYDVVLRLLQHRLLSAATLVEHQLILECFHPTAKFTTPGFSCDYLGTDCFHDNLGGMESLYANVEKTGRLGKLASLYSHFKPIESERDRRPKRRHPAGDVPGRPDSTTILAGSNSDQPIQDFEIPSQNISLESHELFTQLCTITNLVKLGPKPGLFMSCVTIGEGVIRVWRDWLAEWAVPPSSKTAASQKVVKEAKIVENQRERMLWLDNGKNVGISLRVGIA